MKQKPFKLKHRFRLYSLALVFISIVSTCLIFIGLDGKFYLYYKTDVLREQSINLAENYADATNLEQYEEMVDWYSRNANFLVWVTDDVTEFISSDSDDEVKDPLFSDEEAENLRRGETITALGNVSKFEDSTILVISPLQKNSKIDGYLVAAERLGTYKNTTVRSMIGLFLAVTITVIFFIYNFVFLQKKLLTPLEELEKGVIKMTEGSHSAVIPVNGIEEITRIAKAFNQMSATIRKEDESRIKFIADISHELRTPLSYVKGYTNALLDGLVTEPQEMKKYLQIISQETNRLQMLVQDLLDLTKLESNILILDKQPLVFSQCVIDVLDKYKILLCEKNLQLNVDLDPEVIIEGDEQRIKQIIENIFENALRYSKQDGQIDILSEAKIGFCTLSITDNGVGMSEEHLCKIKECFYRVNDARTRLDGGAGIGLTIAEQLIKLHGGSIKIQSKLNVGTTVIIEFPLGE
ncbi:MAG: sensor histidine kinase [Bacillus sp. (in: firmicutes)]